MRSRLMTAAMVVAGVLLAAQMAAADQVQEQLRLMEQRMAEMEDRLQATSDELHDAKTTVDEQQALLTESGLVEATEDGGIRSAVGNFLDQVDVGGHVAVSYNNRIYDNNDNNQAINNTFRHPNANTFSFDQLWIALDKAPTEESRAGFHADLLYGESGRVQDTSNGDGDDFVVYSAYVSYLAPVADGLQFDFGKTGTLLGAEVVSAPDNFNITQGAVFGLQPVTHVGLLASLDLGGGFSMAAGVVNDVYTDTSIDFEEDKVFTGQIAYATDSFRIGISNIVGKDSTLTKQGGAGAGGACTANDNCNTSVLDLEISADPSDSTSMWLNFDWKKTFGSDVETQDSLGLAAAIRQQVGENTGISGRFEYLWFEEQNGWNDDYDFVTLTATLDQALTDALTLRVEGRWDTHVGSDENSGFGLPNGGSAGTFNRGDQFVGYVEAIYAF